MVGKTLFCCAWVVLAISPVAAQTTLNPDISLVGDIRGFSHNNPVYPDQEHRFNLDDPGLELVIAGYLNPYARADAVLSWEGGDNAGVEEAYVTFLRGLPLNTNLRVGQYLLEFGHLNPNHPHAYPFIHRPLPHEAFFGPDGLRDMAVRASVLLPTGNTYSEVQFAVLQGDLLPGTPPDSADSTSSGSDVMHLGYFGRLGASVAATDNAELAFGVSGLTAIYDPAQLLRAWTGGVDLKYKWKPNRNKSLQVESELLWQQHEMAGQGNIHSVGGYAYIDYHFRQRYNLGGIAEYTQAAFSPDQSVSRTGLFIGFAPVEETSVLRLEGDWTVPEGQDGFYSLTLQLVFGLGPHQPHTF